MPRINAALLEKLRTKLGLSRSRVYSLIDAKVRTAHLPRDLAAIAVAAEHGINISRFASADDLATLRNTAISAAPAPVIVPNPRTPRRGGKKSSVSRGNRRRGTTVFVVHGRDLAARDAVFAFLRSLALRPLEWTQALRLTRKGSPYVGEVLDAAFREAAAIVVLLTPDDEARLDPVFLQAGDPKHERVLTGQARANVLFEAGMAFGKDPNSTVLVQLGDTRPFSDVGGRHVLYLSDTPASRQEFATKLANAGCKLIRPGPTGLAPEAFVRDASIHVEHRGRDARAGKRQPNSGVKAVSGLVCGRQPSCLPSRQRDGVTPAADRDSALRTSFAAVVVPRRSRRVKPAAAYTKDVIRTGEKRFESPIIHVVRQEGFSSFSVRQRPWGPAAIGAAATAAVAVVFRVTSLDLDLQALAYDPATSGWPYAQRFPWKLLHDVGTLPGLVLALGAIALIGASFLRPRYARWRFPALYIVALTALGPGVITNLFGKILAGRPRPDEIIEFGGTIRFLEPFEFGTPGKGFSFLCGHCSMGYLFVAFFFLLKGPLRWLALAGSLGYGLLLGVARVADGAHFPSDVTLAGTTTFMLAAALEPLARVQVSAEAWKRRGKFAAAAVAAAIALLVFFSFSTPINRERVHTWSDVPRRAATHETVMSWDRARALTIDVERGDVHVRRAPQREAVVIISQVNGFGFPGSDGRTETEHDGATVVYRHRLTGFLWEARARFDVIVASSASVEVHVTTRNGKVFRYGR